MTAPTFFFVVGAAAGAVQAICVARAARGGGGPWNGAREYRRMS